MALACGLDLSDERRAVIARVLDSESFTSEELEACARHLATSSELDDKLRYGGALTPADFVRARRHVARTSAPSTHIPEMRYGGDWLRRMEQEDIERGRPPKMKLLSAEEAQRPKALAPKRQSAAPDPDAPRCEKHGRALIDDGFCAACEVENARTKHSRT